MKLAESYKKWAYTWGKCTDCGEWTTFHLNISDDSILYFKDDLLSSLMIHAIRKIRRHEYIPICPDCMKDLILPTLSEKHLKKTSQMTEKAKSEVSRGE